MKDWAILAAKAKEIAKKIITGEEENKKGVRLIHIVERLDTFASNSLNAKFPQSKGSIHTYWGGNQVIDTKHSDGSEGHFNSNGTINSTDAPMDLEVSQYINSHLDESKSNKYMKKVINEAQLRQIVAESVKRVLKEGIMGGAMRNVYNDAKNGYAQGYDNFSDFAKDARDYVKNQDTDFGRERYKQYKQDYKNAPKNSEERGYYAQKALENKPGLGGRITRAASVPLVAGAHLAGKVARRFGGNSQVKEAKIYAEVLRMINEDAGHLYWHDENGKAHTNSRETWRGVKGTIYVYHGDWSDPEVLYDGEEINYWDLEENAWDSYKCECEDNGKEPSEQEFDNLPSSWFEEYLDYEYMPGRFGENY